MANEKNVKNEEIIEKVEDLKVDKETGEVKDDFAADVFALSSRKLHMKVRLLYILPDIRSTVSLQKRLQTVIIITMRLVIISRLTAGRSRSVYSLSLLVRSVIRTILSTLSTVMISSMSLRSSDVLSLPLRTEFRELLTIIA